jgi:hypothetical protein
MGYELFGCDRYHDKLVQHKEFLWAPSQPVAPSP